MAEVHVSDPLFGVISDPGIQRVVIEGTLHAGKLTITEQYTLAAPPLNLERGTIDADLAEDGQGAVDHLEIGPVDGNVHLFFVKDGADPDTRPDVFADFWFPDVDIAETPPAHFGQTLVLDG